MVGSGGGAGVVGRLTGTASRDTRVVSPTGGGLETFRDPRTLGPSLNERLRNEAKTRSSSPRSPLLLPPSLPRGTEGRRDGVLDERGQSLTRVRPRRVHLGYIPS